MKTCERCKFCVVEGDGEYGERKAQAMRAGAPLGSVVRLGECRRNPPGVVFAGMHPQAGPLVQSMFPRVKVEEEWCGEWVGSVAVS